MDRRNKTLLLTGLIWSEVMVLISLTQEKDMEFGQILLIAAVPALITGLITMAASRKSQLNKLSDRLDALQRALGLHDQENLKHTLDVIKSDIGRGERGSLSKQHEYITGLMNQQYDEIKQRYSREDEAYRSFSRQQYDLKSVLDGFSRDYAELALSESKLTKENLKLKKENEKLLKENLKLKRQMDIDGIEPGEIGR